MVDTWVFEIVLYSKKVVSAQEETLEVEAG